MRDLTEEILDRAEDFTEGGFLFQEFLENQGTKLHFLYLMVNQLEQSSEAFEEARRKESQAKSKKSKKAARPQVEKEEMIPFDDQEMIDFSEYEELDTAPKKKPRKRRRKVRTESALPSPLDEE